MRLPLLPVLAALSLASLSATVVAEECPLDASLKSHPDAFVERLKSLPAVQSKREDVAQTFSGQCNYKSSSFMQMALPPAGLCSVGGQPAMMSMTDILDSKAMVVSSGFMLLKSDAALAAVQSALSKLGTAVPRDADPKAWTPMNRHWAIDAIYARGDDLWTVVHQELEPGETSSAPPTYMVSHVRREWLDFSRRDLNRCASLPESSQPAH